MKMVFTNVRIVSFQRLHNQISKKINKFFILKSKFPIKNKNDYKFFALRRQRSNEKRVGRKISFFQITKGVFLFLNFFYF